MLCYNILLRRDSTRGIISQNSGNDWCSIKNEQKIAMCTHKMWQRWKWYYNWNTDLKIVIWIDIAWSSCNEKEDDDLKKRAKGNDINYKGEI